MSANIPTTVHNRLRVTGAPQHDDEATRLSELKGMLGNSAPSANGAATAGTAAKAAREDHVHPIGATEYTMAPQMPGTILFSDAVAGRPFSAFAPTKMTANTWVYGPAWTATKKGFIRVTAAASHSGTVRTRILMNDTVVSAYATVCLDVRPPSSGLSLLIDSYFIPVSPGDTLTCAMFDNVTETLAYTSFCWFMFYETKSVDPRYEHMLAYDPASAQALETVAAGSTFFPNGTATATGNFYGSTHTIAEDGFIRADGVLRVSSLLSITANVIQINNVTISVNRDRSASPSSEGVPCTHNNIPVKKGDQVKLGIYLSAGATVTSDAWSTLTFYKPRAIPPRYHVYTDKGNVATRADLPATAADFDTYHITDEHQAVYARYTAGVLTWHPVRVVNTIESAWEPDISKQTEVLNTTTVKTSGIYPATITAANAWVDGTPFTLPKDGYYYLGFVLNLPAAATTGLAGLRYTPVGGASRMLTYLGDGGGSQLSINYGPARFNAGDQLMITLHSTATGAVTSSTCRLFHYPPKSSVPDPAATAFNAHVANAGIHVTQTQLDALAARISALEARVP